MVSTTELSEAELRQRGLEHIADAEGFSEKDLVLLGRILSLKDYPGVRSVRRTDYYGGTQHYDIVLDKSMNGGGIKIMLRDFPAPAEIRLDIEKYGTALVMFKADRTPYTLLHIKLDGSF